MRAMISVAELISWFSVAGIIQRRLVGCSQKSGVLAVSGTSVRALSRRWMVAVHPHRERGALSLFLFSVRPAGLLALQDISPQMLFRVNRLKGRLHSPPALLCVWLMFVGVLPLCVGRSYTSEGTKGSSGVCVPVES